MKDTITTFPKDENKPAHAALRADLTIEGLDRASELTRELLGHLDAVREIINHSWSHEFKPRYSLRLIVDGVEIGNEKPASND